jgi:hypothetical protein
MKPRWGQSGPLFDRRFLIGHWRKARLKYIFALVGRDGTHSATERLGEEALGCAIESKSVLSILNLTALIRLARSGPKPRANAEELPGALVGARIAKCSYWQTINDSSSRLVALPIRVQREQTEGPRKQLREQCRFWDTKNFEFGQRP